jgi:hypothetical protein
MDKSNLLADLMTLRHYLNDLDEKLCMIRNRLNEMQDRVLDEIAEEREKKLQNNSSFDEKQLTN